MRDYRGPTSVLRDARGWRQICAIKWSLGIPEATRQLTMDAILAVRTSPRTAALRPPRPGAFEARGEAALTGATEEVKRPWVLRIYYLSAGGERVYAEFGGLTEGAAVALKREYGYSLVDQFNNRFVNKLTGALDAECWPVARPLQLCNGDCRDGSGKLRKKPDRAACAKCGGTGKVPTPPPAPADGFRQVVFPSEVRDAVTIVPDAQMSA